MYSTVPVALVEGIKHLKLICDMNYDMFGI